MKKNEIIDFVLDNGSQALVRGLSNLGDFSKLKKIHPSASAVEFMEVVREGNIPYVAESQMLIHSLYTTDEILKILKPIADEYYKNPSDIAAKEFVNLFYFGLDEDGKFFGTFFFLEEFRDFFEGKQIHKFSWDRLKKVTISRTGPDYFLKYRL